MTILIVNRELGFVVWLGGALSRAGETAMPATDIAQAKKIQHKLQKPIDILMIDPSLEGAAAFVDSVRRSSRFVKVFEVKDHWTPQTKPKPIRAPATRTDDSPAPSRKPKRAAGK